MKDKNQVVAFKDFCYFQSRNLGKKITHFESYFSNGVETTN